MSGLVGAVLHPGVRRVLVIGLGTGSTAGCLARVPVGERVEVVVHDLDRVRARIATEPYRTALARTWGVDGVEGLYAGYVSAPPFARAVRQAEGSSLNTDDRSILEFGFARNLGRFGLFRPADLL